MKAGTNIRKTRKGHREILSVSIPVSLYDKLIAVCEIYDMNRSAVVSSAIRDYLVSLGMKVGER